MWCRCCTKYCCRGPHTWRSSNALFPQAFFLAYTVDALRTEAEDGVSGSCCQSPAHPLLPDCFSYLPMLIPTPSSLASTISYPSSPGGGRHSTTSVFLAVADVAGGLLAVLFQVRCQLHSPLHCIPLFAKVFSPSLHVICSPSEFLTIAVIAHTRPNAYACPTRHTTTKHVHRLSGKCP